MENLITLDKLNFVFYYYSIRYNSNNPKAYLGKRFLTLSSGRGSTMEPC